jgi:hypothetical protein
MYSEYVVVYSELRAPRVVVGIVVWSTPREIEVGPTVKNYVALSRLSVVVVPQVANLPQNLPLMAIGSVSQKSR